MGWYIKAWKNQGNLEALGFIELLRIGLLPFIKRYFIDGHRLYMDNDSKHNSRVSNVYLQLNGINRIKAPPNSPVFIYIILNNL